MMKKLIAAVLAAATVMSVNLAFADTEKVEISFRVGDSVLKINGADTEVETPYVAGEGVTLVPLRVITEAFGAQVDWEGSSRTITLTYPDVNIVLQIDNIVAKVNEHSETLLEAPALSANGVTMVPLRFISETFGATVGYDSETSAILVTKETIGASQTVTGVTEMNRTGDSYYGWSIDTPVQMKMTDRRLDGMRTEFTADDDSTMYIDVMKYTEDELVSFDEEFAKIKGSFSDYMLSEADKLTDEDGNQYMHIQGKNKDEIIDYCEYYGKDNTIYKVVSYIKIDNDTSTRDMILSLSKSFKIGKIDNQTYDISNVAEGMRTVKDDTYKFKFKLPADFVQLTSSGSDNEFRFMARDEKKPSTVSLAVYSKTENLTAKSLAQLDHDSRLKHANAKYVTLTSVEGIGNNAYKYTQTISGSSASDCYEEDVFFEKGGYIYNLSVLSSKSDKSFVDKIVTSFEAEEIDSSKVGKLIRNDPDEETIITKKIGNDYTIELPASWESTSRISLISGANSGTYVDPFTGSMISVTVNKDDSYSTAGLPAEANSYSNYIKKTGKNITMLGNITVEPIEKTRFAHFRYLMKTDEGKHIYVTSYMTMSKGVAVIFSLYEDDIFYNEAGNETFLNAVGSLTQS